MNVNNKLKYKEEELTKMFLVKSVITDVSSDMAETIYQVIIITSLFILNHYYLLDVPLNIIAPSSSHLSFSSIVAQNNKKINKK